MFPQRTSAAAMSFVTGLFTVGAGCSMAPVHDHERDRFGHVFYFDGAGGGGVLTNWGNGVRDGLAMARYRGDFYNFPWHTGLGVAADQAASVAYKREKAAAAAAQIRSYLDGHPGQKLNVIGLSAGTAVAVFALEALPESHTVNEVVLLGSSLSSHYDLRTALRRVQRHLYVFTSEKDAVLGVAVAVAGTADREFCGACSAGLKGFHIPARADPGTIDLYRRVINIAWMPEFARAGNYGGHTDAVNASFVRDYVAPLLFREGPAFIAAGVQPDRPPAAGA